MEEFLSLSLNDLPIPKAHAYLLGSIAPRPIALVSTLDRNNIPNLAPFSYFNVFSTRPPLLIIGPNRSGTTQRNKDTLINAWETFEVVVNIVNYPIVQQINIASAEYSAEINEFEKSGLTPIPSEIVKPFRVKESPIQLECKVREIIALGAGAGAGNLILCEVLKIHINTAYLDTNGMIDQRKLELVARMGGNWYCKASAENMFELPKPANEKVGWDVLPSYIKNTHILTGNELGKLALFFPKPTPEEVEVYKTNHVSDLQEIQASPQLLPQRIQQLIQQNRLHEAWLMIYSMTPLADNAN
ncbi:MAG: flavin reductase family protein [Bacteroidia bacterium]|nr:flavin reductase family protein [Bacteroidia bacterium]MDW8157681.1 flavin reductase family protein [Bacteroidia bacterium]